MGEIPGLQSDKWDRRFMELADFIAQWSKDPSTKVGAVVVDPRNKRVVSTGFNGFPFGVEDKAERLDDRSVKYEMVVHAETNALMFAGGQAQNCTLYVTPLPPCARCAVLVIQAGIRRVVSPTPDTSREPWKTQFEISSQMFKEAGVTVDFLDV